MSENLIYGADILSYGADREGKNDSSDAFIKAIGNGENLISIPYGNYLIKKPIVLSSNIKLHFHPSSCITYSPDTKDASPFISAKDESSIEIVGGIFNIEDKSHGDCFAFNCCENIRITGCTLNTPCAQNSIRFSTCSYITLSDITFNGKSDAVLFVGECSNAKIKKCTVKAATNVFCFGTNKDSCNVQSFYANGIDALYCDSFAEFLKGKASDVSFENISARFSFDFVKLFDGFVLDEASFDTVKAYIVDRDCNDGKAKAYFALACCPNSFEIRDFSRLSDMESTPLIPTLILKNADADKAKMIIDGIALDNVICARGKSKTVEMTTAKLSNPCGKFIYTLEIGVAKNDVFTLPLGGFDYLTVDRY